MAIRSGRRVEKALDLPHERDEKPAAPSRPRSIMKRAAIDLENGLVDTDRRSDALEIFRHSEKRRRVP